MWIWVWYVKLCVAFPIRGVLRGGGGAEGLLKKGSSGGGGGPRPTWLVLDSLGGREKANERAVPTPPRWFDPHDTLHHLKSPESIILIVQNTAASHFQTKKRRRVIFCCSPTRKESTGSEAVILLEIWIIRVFSQ